MGQLDVELGVLLAKVAYTSRLLLGVGAWWVVGSLVLITLVLLAALWRTDAESEDPEV